MGVPTSEVGYTIATSRRETTKVHKNMWWHWEKKKTMVEWTCLNITLYVHSLSSFVRISRKNSDFYTIKQLGFYNGDRECLLRDTSWFVKQRDCVQFLQTYVQLITIWALSQNCATRLLDSSCLSVRLHGTTRHPQDGFSWNFIFEYFLKICRENSRLIQIRQE